MTNVNEMIALLEAHIANEAVVVNTNTNEEAEMNTQSNVVSETVEMSIAQLNDDCMRLDNMYEWYVLVPVNATATIINGVLKENQIDVLQYAETLTTKWEYRMVGEDLVPVLDEGDVIYVNTVSVQNVRQYYKQLTGDRIPDAIFFCTEEMDMVKITFHKEYNNMSLNYLWDLIDTEAYFNNYEYEEQHYNAIMNLISDYTSYIDEMLGLEQAEDCHCGGIFWESKDLPIMEADRAQQLMEWIQEFNDSFKKEYYAKDFNHILFTVDNVVPF